jgi:hypothetical protein
LAEKTSWTGTATETDINTYLTHTGGAWTVYTPVVYQGGTVVTINDLQAGHSGLSRASYWKSGRFVRVSLCLVLNGTGAINTVEVTLPFTAAYNQGIAPQFDGICRLYDASLVGAGNPFRYAVPVQSSSGARVAMMAITDPAGGLLGSGGGWNNALSGGDTLYLDFSYETTA